MFVCLFLFYVLVFWTWGLWDLTSPTRDPTHTHYTRKWSLNHWTAREVLGLGLERWDSEGFIMSKKHISSLSWENKICLSTPVITALFWKCLLQKAPKLLKCFSVHKAPSKPAQKVERSILFAPCSGKEKSAQKGEGMFLGSCGQESYSPVRNWPIWLLIQHIPASLPVLGFHRSTVKCTLRSWRFCLLDKVDFGRLLCTNIPYQPPLSQGRQDGVAA